MKKNLSEEITHDPNKAYSIVPCWIDSSGRTRSWTLLSPAGDRIADTTTKHGARNLMYLLCLAQGITWNLESVQSKVNGLTL